MAWVLRWKLTAAMAAVYAIAAGAVILFVRDQAAAAAVLVLLFALVLLAGNMYARTMDKAQGAGRRAQVIPGGAGRDSSRLTAHGSRPPEIGRR